jgi:hypothetical protein
MVDFGFGSKDETEDDDDVVVGMTPATVLLLDPRLLLVPEPSESGPNSLDADLLAAAAAAIFSPPSPGCVPAVDVAVNEERSRLDE